MKRLTVFHTWICLTLFVVMTACTTEQPETPEAAHEAVERDDQMLVTQVPDIVRNRSQTAAVEK